MISCENTCSHPASTPRRAVDVNPLLHTSSQLPCAGPRRAILDELFHSERLRVAKEESLEDATQSLRTMLLDFASKTQPKANAEAIADRLDMTFVSREYELEIQRPLRNALRGDLVQMMLIQIQSIKHELMVAMGAVDQLLMENQFNLQVGWTKHAVLFAGFRASSLATKTPSGHGYRASFHGGVRRIFPGAWFVAQGNPPNVDEGAPGHDAGHPA